MRSPSQIKYQSQSPYFVTYKIAFNRLYNFISL